MKKIVCFFMVAVMMASAMWVCAKETISTEYMSEDLTADSGGVLTVSAGQSKSPALEIKGKAAVLMERDTGKILYSLNPTEKCAPASITKIMSLLLVMEAINTEKISLNTTVTASEHACSMGGSQIWLEPGETMTVDELLRATVIASANDATVALAELVSGSEEAFVAEMNRRAKSLGMENTHFINCSGLDAKGHYSTAEDIAIMSCALLKHDLIKKYTTVWMDELRGGSSQLVNTNKLVRFYQGATGLKTGTTSAAGFCVSASAQRQGMELCAVVLGSANNDERFGTARRLLDYGFANWGVHTVEIKGSDIPSPKVKKGFVKSIKVAAAGKGVYLIEKGLNGKITTKIELKQEIAAPVAMGQKLGEAKIMYGNRLIGSIDLVAAEGVKKQTFGLCLSRIFHGLVAL